MTKTYRTFLLSFTLILLVAGLYLFPFKPTNALIYKKTPSIVNGFDWSIPNYQQKTSNHFNNENKGSLIVELPSIGTDLVPKNANTVFTIVRWDEANPKRNVFDFSKLNKTLNTHPSVQHLIRFEVNSICETPSWAQSSLRHDKRNSLIFWDDNYLETISPFISNFGEAFAHHPQIIGVQLGIGDGEYNNNCEFHNKDGWGEFWMSPKMIKEAEMFFNFNPSTFERQSKRIIDLYTQAFGSNVGKLAFTNLGPYSWGNKAKPYNEALNRIGDYALNAGTGSRDGGTEQWMRWVDSNYGMKLTKLEDKTCRLDFDESFAKKINGRYWGSENEFYGEYDYVKALHGSYESQPYRFLISSLRTHQMRRNFVSIDERAMTKIDHPIYKTQDFLKYYHATIGRNIHNTPDAFVLMGERYIKPSDVLNLPKPICFNKTNNGVPIRSFGRWLTDSTGGTPTHKITMPKSDNHWGQDIYLPDGVDYEYAARAIDNMSFDLNDELISTRCKTSCPIEIKVTYLDENQTNVYIETKEGTTKEFKTNNDNQIKTITFSLSPQFKPSKEDFFIKTTGKPISILLVRVNFLNPPQSK